MSSLNTSPHLRGDTLERLGLQQATLGRAVELPATRRRASRRFDRPDRDDAGELGFDDFLYPPGSRPAIEVGDVLVQACASTRDHVFAIRARSGTDLGVSTTGAVPWANAPHDPSTVYIESPPGTATTVVQADGRGVLVVHEPGKGVVAYDVDRAQAPAADARSAASPEFLVECCPPWVSDLIAEHLHAGRPFELAVAMGLYSRFGSAADDNPTAAISLLLAGLPDTDTGRAQFEFAARPRVFHDAVIAATVAHAYALLDAIEAIHMRALTGDARVHRAVSRVALGRDDLECARVMLAVVGREGEAAVAIDALDERAIDLVDRGVLLLDTEGDRLRAAGRNDPSAWWANCTSATAHST